MAVVRSAARIARATQLRNLAVELVALRGAMADAQDGGKTIQVMTFEGDRLSVLYKTPRVPLSTGGAPAQFRPKDFMVDVWFDGLKTLSVQWDHEEPVKVVVQARRMGKFNRKGAVKLRNKTRLSCVSS